MLHRVALVRARATQCNIQKMPFFEVLFMNNSNIHLTVSCKEDWAASQKGTAYQLSDGKEILKGFMHIFPQNISETTSFIENVVDLLRQS
jgi:hypothetical protein